MSTSSVPNDTDVDYPESDGQPMGEAGIHVHCTMDIYGTLKVLSRDRADVYVTADIFVYYERGNSGAVKAPDVIVAIGVDGNHERRTYKLWEEGMPPRVAFEVTSEETRREDTTTKFEFYARLGIVEYFLFDPLADYLDPPLQGFRLDGDRYSAIRPDDEGWVESREMGVKIHEGGTFVRFAHAGTGVPLPSIFEPGHREGLEQIRRIEALERELAVERRLRERDQRSVARAKKQAEREAKKAEAERQKAETAELKADAERQKAEAAELRVEVERQEAEAAELKAEALEAEVKRLRELLAGCDPGGS